MATARHFVDRKLEIALFRRMLAGESERRLLAILDRSERGKSYFLWHLRDTCRADGIPVTLLDFHPDYGGLTTYLQMARHLCDELGRDRFPAFQDAFEAHFGSTLVNIQMAPGQGGVDFGERGRYGRAQVSDVTGRDRVSVGDIDYTGSETSARQQQAALMDTLGLTLRDDLARFCADCPPVVILMDTFERAPAETRAWLARWLLRPLAEAYPRLVLVVAGRPEPDVTSLLEGPRPWRHLTHPIRQFSQFTLADIRAYFTLRGLPAPEQVLEFLLPVFRDDPMQLSQIADRLEREAAYG